MAAIELVLRTKFNLVVARPAIQMHWQRPGLC